MNSLSLLIYFAEVITTQTMYLYAVFIGAPFAYLVYKGVCKINASVVYSWDSEPVKVRKTAEQDKPFIESYWIVIAPLIGVFFLNFIPTSQTLYLIAGSEAGEMAVTSEAGKEILSDIQAVIKAQLDALKPKGS